MMKKRKEPVRPYKLVHQLLSLKNINFHKQSYIGVTELTLVPLKPFTKVKLNLCQAKIFKILLNDFIDCTYAYHDPTLDICQDEVRAKQKSADSFAMSHFEAVAATDADRNRGEIVIQIPQSLTQYVSEGKDLKVTVEFGVERPLGGIHFVVPDGEGSLADRGAHMFSSGFENCSRLWFPCIDTFSETCLWKLEFTCDVSMIAISCGDLKETVLSSDMKRKTYHYELITPTSASNIGLAVGPFQVMVDPNMHEVTHFCLPHLYHILKETCSFLHEAFEFYEELLSTRYPYSCYKQVFVDESYSKSQSFATFTILDTNLLHSKHIIDQTYETRQVLSHSLAQQFFGCFISVKSWSDAWLNRGISGFLASQYYKKAFGNNEYRFWVQQQLRDVIDYEATYGGFSLDPAAQRSTTNEFYFSNRSLQTFSPLFNAAYTKKAVLVVRMLEERIGRELLLQVFNKLLTLATIASQQKMISSTPNVWNNILLSTSSFSKAIFTVTGKEIDHFLNEWVYKAGHAKFKGSFNFNRKRNTVELEIRQQETSATGARRYMGPLVVWIQELDGTFKHNLQIEENVTKHDITCHSKSRRNKKKKIPLCTGEEVDMDLQTVDAESPVLWIRVDPDMQLLRQVNFEQPDFQWQTQMRYERDVTAQLEAINHLERFQTAFTKKALTDVIENDQCFYKIRCEAALCLRTVANSMANIGNGPPTMSMITMFKKLYGSFSSPNIIRLNDFNNFQLYFLQKVIPVAIGGLRSNHGICPQDVIRFLLDLFKYNDNSKNKFSDNYYRASLIEALAETITPAVTRPLYHQSSTSAEALSSETKLILEEITRYFNLDKLMPCYKYTVTVACLKTIRRLQKMSHLPTNAAFFKEYAQYGVFIEVRFAAIEAIVDIIKAEKRREDLDFILELVEVDPIHAIRHKCLRVLTLNPPFTKKDATHVLNTEDLVDRLWNMMNTSLTHDSQLRTSLLDLYFTLYGRSRPSVLPKPEFSVVLNLKEKTATSQITDDHNHGELSGNDVKDDESRKRSGDPIVESVKRFKPEDESGPSGILIAVGDASNNQELEEGEIGPDVPHTSSEKKHKKKKKKHKKHKHKHKHHREDKDKERHRESSVVSDERAEGTGHSEPGSGGESP